MTYLPSLTQIYNKAANAFTQAPAAFKALPKSHLLNAVQAGALLHVMSYVGMQKAGIANTPRNQLKAAFVATVITTAASHLVRANALLTAIVAAVTLATGMITHKALAALLKPAKADNTEILAQLQALVPEVTGITNLTGAISEQLDAAATREKDLKNILAALAGKVKGDATAPAGEAATIESLSDFISTQVEAAATRQEDLEAALGAVITALDVETENSTPQALVANLLEQMNGTVAELKASLKEKEKLLENAGKAPTASDTDGANPEEVQVLRKQLEAAKTRSNKFVALFGQLKTFASNHPNYTTTQKNTASIRQELAKLVASLIRQIELIIRGE